MMELPPGFRFHPTDEELVMHYLCRKCASLPIAVPNVITEIDLYQYNPWELPGLASYGEKEWYFFSPRERKYPNGSRPNRTAGRGYWKATGADKAVGRPKAVAIKKALVFYTGKAPRGEKSNWIMHEYRLADVDRSASTNNNSSRLDDWVLCRIYNKKGTSVHNQQLGSRRRSNYGESGEKKPEFLTNQGSNRLGLPPPPPPGASNELAYHDSSDSIPRLHTDSSTTEHVAWPEFGCDMEVESQPKLEDWEHPALFSFYNYLDATTALDHPVFQSSLMSPL